MSTTKRRIAEQDDERKEEAVDVPEGLSHISRELSDEEKHELLLRLIEKTTTYGGLTKDDLRQAAVEASSKIPEARDIVWDFGNIIWGGKASE